MKKNKKNHFISPLTIIFFLLIFVIFISWIWYWLFPSNEIHPAGLLEVFSAPIQGFINSATTLIFILSIGCYMQIVKSSHALDALISKIFNKFQKKEMIFIVIIFILFAILGSCLGVWSVIALPFYFLLIPLLISAGFDKFVVLLIVFFGSEIGVLGSTINPILISNAIELTNNKLGYNAIFFSDGFVWRIVSFFILTIIGLIFTVIYSNKHRIKNEIKNVFVNDKNRQMTKTKQNTLIILFFTFLIMLLGIIPWDTVTGMNGFELLGQQLATSFPYLFGQNISDGGAITSNFTNFGDWSLMEIAILFLISSFVTAVVNWKNEINYTNEIIKGASSMMSVIFLISIASGLTYILDETGIQNILINSLSDVSQINGVLLIVIMFFIMLLISMFIPSISAFTKAIYPTLGPSLAIESSSISVSGSILCTSFANGIIHLSFPTSTTLIYGLNACDISFKDYYKKMWLPLSLIFITCIVLLIIGVYLPGNIF